MRRFAKILWAAGALCGFGFGLAGLAQAMPMAASGITTAGSPASAVEKAHYYHRHYNYHHHYYHHHHHYYHRRGW
ncbi:conserved exported hypothetical protein [Methylocella tundrae]|jgi:hypothetical protein|uniref:Uncharacterized protein n=1 Tax=Methylocella tundrae TaxID=227605 RepID=A0A8B6MA94_METTU|nr:hypothetical protein [Methylocella tundrae]VTZ27047.1 conserved exported hypothetical protein [Methylocella tundrae]VTZ50974.1 conserved exported hypothetical protein [Methylocella tundrae]